MKFNLKRFNIGDRVVMANNRYGEPIPEVGTEGVIAKIYTYTSSTRPGETLYKILWKEASGEFYWNIADSALALEKEWEGEKEPIKKEGGDK